MGKYQSLWNYILNQNLDELVLSFDTIASIVDFEIDHSFLKYKKELLEYGFQVEKISMKNQSIKVMKIKG